MVVELPNDPTEECVYPEIPRPNDSNGFLDDAEVKDTIQTSGKVWSLDFASLYTPNLNLLQLPG